MFSSAVYSALVCRALGQPVRQASALTHERGHASLQIVNSEQH